jgi:hypothetical protein
MLVLEIYSTVLFSLWPQYQVSGDMKKMNSFDSLDKFIKWLGSIIEQEGIIILIFPKFS